MDNTTNLIVAISSKKIQEIIGFPIAINEHFLRTVGHIRKAVEDAERGLPQMKLNTIIIAEVIKYFTPSSTILDEDPIPETVQEQIPDVTPEVDKKVFDEYEIVVSKSPFQLGLVPDTLELKSIGIRDNSYIIDETCNCFVASGEDVFIGPGNYTPEQLADIIPDLVYDSITRKFCFNVKVDFDVKNSIHKKLGFKKTSYKPGKFAEDTHRLRPNTFTKVTVNGSAFYIENSKTWKEINCVLKTTDVIDIKVLSPDNNQIDAEFFVIFRVKTPV